MLGSVLTPPLELVELLGRERRSRRSRAAENAVAELAHPVGDARHGLADGVLRLRQRVARRTGRTTALELRHDLLLHERRNLAHGVRRRGARGAGRERHEDLLRERVLPAPPGAQILRLLLRFRHGAHGFTSVSFSAPFSWSSGRPASSVWVRSRRLTASAKRR